MKAVVAAAPTSVQHLTFFEVNNCCNPPHETLPYACMCAIDSTSAGASRRALKRGPMKELLWARTAAGGDVEGLQGKERKKDCACWVQLPESPGTSLHEVVVWNYLL